MEKLEKLLLDIEIYLNRFKKAIYVYEKAGSLSPAVEKVIYQIKINIDLVYKALKKEDVFFVIGNIEEIGKLVSQLDESPLTSEQSQRLKEAREIHLELAEKLRELKKMLRSLEFKRKARSGLALLKRMFGR